MFSKLKHFYTVKHKLTNFNRFYCSDKLKDLPEIIIEKDKPAQILEKSRNIIVQSYEECAEFEERILKQVLVEKEKEATQQSRLSKECKTFLTTPVGKIGAVKCPVLHLEHIPLQQDWDQFDHLHGSMTEKLSPVSLNDPKIEVPAGSVKKNEPPASAPTTTLKTGGSSVVPGGGDTAGIATRPIRQEPGKVILCFIPKEWWLVFIPKTGVTGFGTFLFSFSMFLVSKELYVLEHYFYHGLGALGLWACAIKYVGPFITKMLDKDLDKYEKDWNEGRVNEKQVLEDQIGDELYLQYQMEGQMLLNEAKRENVKLQLEEEYRKRQMIAYNAVKQRLDYHVEMELVKQRIQQKNLVDYVTREVKKAITPDVEKKLIYYSIDNIIADLNQPKK